MKICTKCNQSKPLSEFFKRKSKYGPKEHSYCKECHRLYCKRRRYTGEYLYGKKGMAWFIELKDKPCTDCHYEYPHYVMEWDHIPERGQKTELIQLVKKGASKERILHEISKCELVCANCHKKRTYWRIKDSQQKELLEIGALL